MAHTPFRGGLALSFVAHVTSAAMRIGRGMPTPHPLPFTLCQTIIKRLYPNTNAVLDGIYSFRER